MTKLIKAICSNCQTSQEVYWGVYGSENACENCECPPVSMTKETK